MESLLYIERARAMIALNNDGMMDRTGTTGDTAINCLVDDTMFTGWRRRSWVSELHSMARFVVYDNMDISRYS